ncbi:TOLL-INTERLEUKIN-RESISTANCE (TIR) DOMAIN FAMILY PROTEIN [Salix viminalis]|uniref:TOLL-INTERLEUKIN-RESISTANCE (TIR) DOMAIN FAMILY PROTEIN n=1 Tax=Salix viminalis TaxID=40686 RepID=A0A9Q0U6Q6_SALVM|nr:TOLL-INTERLEUKIN-RESISTANCE (TIR) DOMAIN FAMILY PROTEIN [Salix viminalis]
MHRTSQFLRHYNRTLVANRAAKPCDVFINHRGIDTKRTVATLLYDHFYRLNLHPFLDSKNMKPGDKLFDNINGAIRKCKVGVAVFSPRYCESYFCLHELALMMESRKKVIPIFCDVKPSQLRVVDNGKCAMEDIRRFNWALEEAKYTVGLTFDSLKGNWSDVVTSASDNIIKTLIEMEDEKQMQRHKSTPILDV